MSPTQQPTLFLTRSFLNLGPLRITIEFILFNSIVFAIAHKVSLHSLIFISQLQNTQTNLSLKALGLILGSSIGFTLLIFAVSLLSGRSFIVHSVYQLSFDLPSDGVPQKTRFAHSVLPS